MLSGDAINYSKEPRIMGYARQTPARQSKLLNFRASGIWTEIYPAALFVSNLVIKIWTKINLFG
jgi:hypothetical protein